MWTARSVFRTLGLLALAPLGAGCTATIEAEPRAPRADAAAPLPAGRDAGPRDVRDRADAPADLSTPEVSPPPAADAALPPLPPGTRRAGVPVLWMTVGGAALQKDVEVTGELTVIEDVLETESGEHVDPRTRPPALVSRVAIDVHGNFTATLPKKPLNLELRDEAGAEVERPLLGMPKGSDWVLLACYTDKTCLRSAIVLDVAAQLGRWNPRFRFVELYVDGKYQGLYNLVERVRRDKHRLDLPKPAADAEAGDLTGGNDFRKEGGGKGNGRDWKSRTGFVWTYHYPRHDEITPAQKRYLGDHMTKFEDAVRGPAWADPKAGYRAFLDLPTLVDYALIQELVNGWDGYARSIYFLKRPTADGGLVEHVPLWDFDLAFGNISMGTNFRTDTWAYENPRTGADAVAFFYPKIWSDPPFRDALRCRWEALRKEIVVQAAIDAKIAAWTRQIAPSIARDQKTWKTLGKSIYPNHVAFATYDEEVAWLRSWIDARIRWLDAHLPGRCAGP